MIPAIISLGIIGIIFGIILGIAGKAFNVEQDPRIDQINEALPGANCGGCGYPGCAGYADAIVSSNADITLCAPGGEDVVKNIASIMGVEASSSEKNVAVIMCSGGKKETSYKYVYDGVKDCKSASMLGGGDKECPYGCLGYGSCVDVCQFDAIKINENGIAEVDNNKCTGCGKCVEACPKNIIKMVKLSSKVHVRCSSIDKGVTVKKYCETGCIGCKLCEKVCPFDAVHVIDNCAVIDYDKCRNCELCVAKCPIKTITSNIIVKKKPVIIEKDCIGCTICYKNCPVEAIEGGKPKEKHRIIEDKCIACNVCVEKCPKKCIKI